MKEVMRRKQYLSWHRLSSFVAKKYSVVVNSLQRHFSTITISIIALSIILGFIMVGKSSKPPKIAKTGSSSLYLYQTGNKSFSAKIGSKDTDDPLVSFTSPTGSQATFSLVGSESKGSEQKGNTITYPNVFPDTNLTYTPLTNGLKEEIIVSRPGSKTEYTFNLITKAHPRPITTEFYSPYFFDDKNVYQFHLEKPFAVDAKGNRTDDATLSLRRSKANKDNYQILLSIPQDWLNSKDRAYPITIDPTVVHDTTAEFATGILNRTTDTGSGSFPALETYYQELPADQYTVALWHMNETSGNIQDSSGNSLTGTPTGAAVVSGLLGNARSFNGSTNFISIPATSKLDSQKLTIEAWLYSTNYAQNGFIFEKTTNGAVNTQYSCFLETASGIVFRTINAVAASDSLTVTLAKAGISNNTWIHLACVYDGTTKKIYVNGKEVASKNYSQTLAVNPAGTAIIGAYGSGTSYFYNGTIDDLRVSNIGRTPEEIKSDASRRPYSTYTSDVLDLYAVGGNVLGWNPLIWSEIGVNTDDGETLSSSTSLVSQWNLNETSGTTTTSDAGSCGTSCNGILTNFASTASQDQAAGTGWTSNNRRWGAGALTFDGINDFVDIGNILDPGLGDYSVDFWLNTNQTTIWRTVQKRGTGTLTTVSGFQIGGTGGILNNTYFTDGVANYSGPFSNDYKINDGKWHYIAVTWQNSTGNLNLFVDGNFKETAPKTGTPAGKNITSSRNFTIGAAWDTAGTQSQFLAGTMDTTRVFTRVITASEILSNYQAGNIEFQTRVGTTANADDGSWEEWRPVTAETVIDNMDNPLDYATPSASIYTGVLLATSSSSFPVFEGTNSLKISSGKIQSGSNTIGLWHFDETGGTGAYVKDSSGNANHGTPTSIGVNDGISNKAYIFNGTTSVVTVPANTAFDFAGDYTLEAWVKTTTTGLLQGIMGKNSVNGWGLNISALNKFNFGSHSCSNFDGFTTVYPNQWYHVVGVYQAAGSKLYVNGVLDGTGTLTGGNCAADTSSVVIGQYRNTSANNFFGTIDEVRVSNVARSSEEIAESYRMGRDHYINKTISSTDLSGKTSLPFYIAADRPGSYLTSIIGGSPFANSQPDANTLGLWHLDEKNTAITDTFVGATLNSFQWVEIDPGANKISQSNRLILSAGAVGAWDSAIVSKSTYPRTIGQTLYFKVTTGASVDASNLLMIGWATDSTVIASYTNITHALYLNAGVFNVFQNGVQFGAVFGSGYVANTSYEFKITLSTAGTASYSVKGGVYTNWTTLLAADGVKANTPLRAQVAQYQFVGTINDMTVLPADKLNDSSGNNISGTTGGVTNIPGKIGQGKSFNGTSDFIVLTGEGAALSSTNYATSAWVNESYDNATNRHIIDNRDSGSDGTRMDIEGGDNFGCLYNATTVAGTTLAVINNWYHVACTSDGSTLKIYVNGVLENSGAITGTIAETTDAVIGARSFTPYTNYFPGIIDEVRYDNTARSADEIRQAFEVGLRSHPITIDFASAISHANTLSRSTDLSFTLMATPSGTTNAGDNIFKGDKIIVRENYNGTEYIAQGLVDSVNISTGAVTVSSWDATSTFPPDPIGFTPNASVFKWQREYWNIDGEVLDSHINAITNLSLRLTDGNEGRTIWLDDLRSNSGYLTTPTGSTVTSSLGNRYFQYRAILSSFDEAVSPTLSTVTVDYVINTAPAIPTLDLPTDAATNQSLTPTLKTTATDTESDYMRYKIIICTDVGMSLGCQTFDQTSSQSGWSGQNADTSQAYTSGTQAIYTISSPLVAATTYYWKSSAIDPAGSNTFGSTQATPFSFTTSTPPSAPSTPWVEGSTNPTNVNNTTPNFTAIQNDPSGDSAIKYQVEVNTNNTFTGTTMWDSGLITMATLANGVRSSNITYAGTGIPLDGLGTTYYWRIRFMDINGALGDWTTAQSFTMNVLPGIPTLDLPANTATGQSLTPTLKTTGIDANTDFMRYKIKLCRDAAMTVGCQTFDQTISQVGWSGQDTDSGNGYASGTQASYTLQTALDTVWTYYWQSWAIDPNGSNVWGPTQASLFSFTTQALPPEPSTCTVEKNTANTVITVNWTDNSTSETGYQVWRVTDGGLPVQLGTNLLPDTITYVDSTVGNGHSYGYLIRNYVIDGITTIYSHFCVTAVSNLNTGFMRFEGIKFN